MIDIGLVIGFIAGAILVPAYLIIVFISLIKWAAERGKPCKPNSILESSHTYYPVKHSKKLKVMIVIDLIGFMCLILPVLPAVIADAAFGINPLVTGIICGVIGLVIVIAVLKNSSAFSTDVECVIVDEQGITIKRTDDIEKHSVSIYKGFVNGGKNNPFHLVFEDNDGNKENVYLPYLAAGDPLDIGKDLNDIKNTGHLVKWSNG